MDIVRPLSNINLKHRRKFVLSNQIAFRKVRGFIVGSCPIAFSLLLLFEPIIGQRWYVIFASSFTLVERTLIPMNSFFSVIIPAREWVDVDVIVFLIDDILLIQFRYQYFVSTARREEPSLAVMVV